MPDLLPGRPRVLAIAPVAGRGSPHPEVWRIETSAGVRLLAKRYLFAPLAAGRPHDLLDTETAVSRALIDRRAPAVHVLGVDRRQGLVFYAFAGDRTLADAAPALPPSARAALCDRLIDAFVAFQAAFEEASPALSPHVFPGCDGDGLRESWSQATETLTGEALAPVLPVTADTLRGVRALAHRLSGRPYLLGPTDYNARNIVLGSAPQDPAAGGSHRRITFVDLAKVGHDWPERRLVQYLTLLGDRPLCLVDRVAATRYARAAARTFDRSPEDLLHDLDAHHLLLHLHLSARFASDPVARSRHGARLRAAVAAPLSESADVIALRHSLASH